MTEPSEGSTSEPLPWGFSHRSRLVTAPDGARSVFKTLTGPGAAAEVLRSVAIAPRIAAAGIPTPTILAAHPESDPAVLVTTFIAGSVGADWLEEPDRARTLAGTMGRLTRDLAKVDASGLEEAGPWSDAGRLAEAARGWLVALDRAAGATSLDSATRMALETAISAMPTLHAAATVRFAHGDYAPVNVLLDGDGALAALLDLGAWRIAHPWFDAAWWGWVVRFHHPGIWTRIWPTFLAAADLPTDGTVEPAVRSLQLLQLLELAAGGGFDARSGRGMWLELLALIAAWD